MKNDIIGWWSGGITSAVTCSLLIRIYGVDRCRFVFIDTGNEDEDTYRFKKDCENWYGKEIETISAIGEKYESIQHVWEKFKSLNVSKGAICSAELKRVVREKWQKKEDYTHQAFGFEMREINRAKSMTLNHQKAKPIYPLLMYGLSKKDCIQIVQDQGIEIPRVYSYGFHNNNCFKTGCVQGGVGYWQKMKKDFPDKFDAMAEMEHKLTDLKGKPVTMCKDQSNEAKKTGITLVFLKKHPKYPEIKEISQLKGREPKPLFECNGFCGTNDLEDRNETEKEINYNEQYNLFNENREEV